MRGELKQSQVRTGTTPKWCSRCGGKHAGGSTKCELVLIYSPASKPARQVRAEIAQLAEEWNDFVEAR